MDFEWVEIVTVIVAAAGLAVSIRRSVAVAIARFASRLTTMLEACREEARADWVAIRKEARTERAVICEEGRVERAAIRGELANNTAETAANGAAIERLVSQTAYPAEQVMLLVDRVGYIEGALGVPHRMGVGRAKASATRQGRRGLVARQSPPETSSER